MRNLTNEQPPAEPVAEPVLDLRLQSESAIRIRLMIANYSCDITSILDMDGSILYISPSLEKITGWTPQEILHRPYIELIHPEDRLLVLQSFSSSARKETCAGSEWRLRCASGNYIWVESLLHHLGNSNNGPNYISASLRDITVRKNFEMEMLKSEERYRSLIENYPYGITLIRDYKFIFFNQVGLKILGYEKQDELAGLKFETLIVPSQREKVHKIHTKMISGIPIYGPREIPVIRKDGTQILLSIDMAFVSMVEGPLMLCYYRDITEDKQTEKHMQKKLEQLRLILHGSRDVFFDWDLKTGHVERACDYTEMFGYAPGELAPVHDAWVNLRHPEDKERVRKAMQDHLEGKTDSYEVEHRILCKYMGRIPRHGNDARRRWQACKNKWNAC